MVGSKVNNSVVISASQAFSLQIAAYVCRTGSLAMSTYSSTHTFKLKGPILGNPLRIVWQAEMGENTWVDYEERVCGFLDRAWQEGLDTVMITGGEEYVFAIRVANQAGIQPALEQRNRTTGNIRKMRRVLVLADPIASSAGAMGSDTRVWRNAMSDDDAD